MNKTLPVFFGLLCLHSGLSPANWDAQKNVIRHAGTLNGIALQCGYFDQTKLMKQVLVEVLPKRRALGLTFDQASHESFLSFAESGRACPNRVELMVEVNESMRKLRQVFTTR